MSTRRAAAPEAREDQHVGSEEVETNSDNIDPDADKEGDANEGGDPDLYQLISALSTYLCQVEEELVFFTVESLQPESSNQKTTVARN